MRFNAPHYAFRQFLSPVSSHCWELMSEQWRKRKEPESAIAAGLRLRLSFTSSFLNHRPLIIFTGKRKLKFPSPLFIPDKSAWPKPPSGAMVKCMKNDSSLQEQKRCSPTSELRG